MKAFVYVALVVLLALLGETAFAADIQLPGVDINFADNASAPTNYSTAIKILLLMTVLSVVPSIIVMITSFTRIIVVLSILRQALGMQQTPPNSVLLSLAMFLTIFSMYPTMMEIYDSAYVPYSDQKLSETEAVNKLLVPLKKFMIKQTREKDLLFMLEVSRSKKPKTLDEVSAVALIPAFMISELKTAFEIGFVIFLPFLLIDIIVAGVLMSMGMLMVPPMMISLPIKILMFVLIDGWSLVLKSLLGGFA